MVCGLTLIFLTACGKNEQAATPLPQAVAASSGTPSLAGFYPPRTSAQGISAPEELNIVVLVDQNEKPASPAEKKAAKAAAEELLRVMLDLESVVDDSSIMNDTWRYGRYFYRAIEDPLTRWQKMTESSSIDIFGDLGYCREAGRSLATLGDMLHSKGLAQEFLDKQRTRYAEALPKCQLAIKAAS